MTPNDPPPTQGIRYILPLMITILILMIIPVGSAVTQVDITGGITSERFTGLGSDGETVGACFTEETGQFLYYSHSTDGGATWTQTNTTISFASSHDNGCDVSVLSSSEILIVYRKDIDTIEAIRSTDGGSTWGTPTRLDSETGRASQPRIERLSDTSAQAYFTSRPSGDSRFDVWSSTFSGGSWGTANEIWTGHEGTGTGNFISFSVSAYDSNHQTLWLFDVDASFSYVTNDGWSTATLIEHDGGGGADRGLGTLMTSETDSWIVQGEDTTGSSSPYTMKSTSTDTGSTWTDSSFTEVNSDSYIAYRPLLRNTSTNFVTIGADKTTEEAYLLTGTWDTSLPSSLMGTYDAGGDFLVSFDGVLVGDDGWILSAPGGTTFNDGNTTFTPQTSFTWNFNQTNAQDGYFSGSASSFSPHWWNWTFGDGTFQNGTTSDVTHVYDSLGTFTVTLNASTIDGSETAETTQTVTVTELGNGTTTEVKDSELVFGLRTGWDPDDYKVWVRTSNPGNSLFGYDTSLNPDIDRSICTETDEFSNSRRDQLAVRVSGDRLVFSCALSTGGGNAYIYDIPSNGLTPVGSDGNDTATEMGWYNDNYIYERSTGNYVVLYDLTELQCSPSEPNCVEVIIPDDTRHSAFDPGASPSLTERLTCITGDNGSRCYRLNQTDIIVQTERDDSLTFDWVQVYNNEVYFFRNNLLKTDKDFNTLESVTGESSSGFLDPRMSKSGNFFVTFHQENSTIQVYDSETLSLVGKSNTVDTIRYLDVTPDNEWVFGSNRTHLFRWNLSTIITNEGYTTTNVQSTSETTGGSDTPNTLEDPEPSSGFGADPENFAEEVGITVTSAAFLFTIILIMVLGGFLYVTMGNSRFMGTIGAFAGLGIGIAFSWVPLWIMYFIGLSIALILGVLVFRRA